MYQVKIASFPNGENRLTFSSCGRPPGSSSSGTTSLPAELADEQSDPLVLHNPGSLAAPHLTLALNSMEAKSAPKTRLKTGRFTLDAKRKILRAGGALDEFDVNSRHCLLLTGTLPGSTREALNEIPKHTGYIVNRLKMWLRGKYSENQFSFYCWELQKRGALHIHYCVYIPNLDASRAVIEGFRSFWIHLLEDISDKTGIDLFAKKYGGTHRADTQHVQADAQRCRKSVAAYMAKYVTKEAGRGHRSRYPSRWSGVSRPLTALIREYTREAVAVTPDYRGARTLYEDAKQYLTGAPKGCHTYRHKVGVGETRVAYYSQDKELQACQFHLASNRLSLSRYCNQLSSVCPEMSAHHSILKAIYSIVHQAYGSPSSTSESSPLDLGGTLLQSLRESIMASQGRISLSKFKNRLMAVTTWSLSFPCVKYMCLLRERFREPFRIAFRCLHHLAEGSLSLPSLEKTLRIVTKGLTTLSENEYRSTTTCETACDAGSDVVQLALI